MAVHFSKVYSAELVGIDARLIEVETDVHVGLHSFTIVGLADKALSEARERVSAALHNSDVKPPSKENRKIVVNLAPADIPKTGSQYDLAIAIGYLRATEQLAPFDAARTLFIGELALDGNVRPVSGVLNMVTRAAAAHFVTIIVPAANAAEAAIVPHVDIIPVQTLRTLIDHLEGRVVIPPQQKTVLDDTNPEIQTDISMIKGQSAAKRALAVAAAGGHHLLMSGPPGTGKTMLARALASILPPLTLPERIEVSKIYSAAGLLENQPLLSARPFRSPHHTASPPAIIGGGSIPRPGEISLAHHGVLFLDEFPEFRRDLLESLRQPLEERVVHIARATGTLTFPAKCMLVAAMNPCPCGYVGDGTDRCHCSADIVSRYQKKVSGPLLDRIDLQIHVPRVDFETLNITKRDTTETETLHADVARARETQRKRFADAKLPTTVLVNADLSSTMCDELIMLNPNAKTLVSHFFTKERLSPRSYYRVLKTAQTIADLESSPTIHERHVAEAIGYRIRTE